MTFLDEISFRVDNAGGTFAVPLVILRCLIAVGGFCAIFLRVVVRMVRVEILVF